MPWCCSVPGCKSNSQLSVFTVPKDRKRRKKWQNVINVKKLKTHHHICEKHFASDDIVHFTEHRDENGYLLARIPLERRYLSSSAIPCFLLPKNEENIIKEKIINNSVDIKDALICHDYAKKIAETDLCKDAFNNVGKPCFRLDINTANRIDEYSALKFHDYSQKAN
ncbi:hypothetical protein PV327_005442 [Microctonus hyperodae]|uniref:THAP-type domain-containing protein n=1 Tax=Microctonus hyperodae TaxID=165561 RepID=A0AA39G1C8_MICHY|nr:hypothetical protein PV327_005442 [Microctonus hyperodae]